MRISKLWAILAPAALILATPASSFADTFQIFTLHSDQSYLFDGMDDAGNVVLYNNGLSTTYYTFFDGISTGQSTAAPTFTWDSGTSCTPSVPAGGSVEHGVCNNGRDAFTGFLAAGQVHPNVYTGPSYQDIFSTGGEGLLFMNAFGDIVFDDHLSNQWFEAFNLDSHPTSLYAAARSSAATVTPEPASVLLLTTGILAPFFFLRRRILSAAR